MSLKRKDAPSSSPADPKKPKKNADLTSFFGAPKITPAGGSKPVSLSNGSAIVDDSLAIRFDKEKWVTSLKDEQRQLLKLEIDTLDPSWLAVLKDEIVTPGFLDLKRFLQKEMEAKQKIYPPLEDVYSWYVALDRQSHETPQADDTLPGPATALCTKPAW
jgi:uracil-DNA glycosylase